MKMNFVSDMYLYSDYFVPTHCSDIWMGGVNQYQDKIKAQKPSIQTNLMFEELVLKCLVSNITASSLK